jgi:hypothetical protein
MGERRVRPGAHPKHYIHPDVERRLRAAGEVLARAYWIEPAADDGQQGRAIN